MINAITTEEDGGRNVRVHRDEDPWRARALVLGRQIQELEGELQSAKLGKSHDFQQSRPRSFFRTADIHIVSEC